MFLEPSTAHIELWEGKKTGIEGAVNIFGAEKGLPFSSIYSEIEKLNVKNVYLDKTNICDHKQLESIAKNKALFDANPLIHSLRMIKSDSEIQLMQRAAEISSQSMIEESNFCYTIILDDKIYQIWHDGEMEFECRIRGAQGLAYVPVVAGGNNANVIHYVSNSCVLNDGDLVLMDAGADMDHYVSDISRTWPVNGKFSQAQSDLYQIVLNVQKSCIQACRQDFELTIEDLYVISVKLLYKELKQIGLDLSIDQLNAVYPHNIGHYLGMDVHDIGTQSTAEKLVEGMLVTVEPGIYIRHDNLTFPKEMRGIGIRIEDDVLVGKESPKVLTHIVPKEIKEIENLMRK